MIEDIRQDAIEYIKKKLKTNPKYLHPCNKERLEDMKRLKFVSGNEFVEWMRQKGMIKSTTKAFLDGKECTTIREYKDKKARDAGFKDWNEKNKEWRHETGRNFPIDFNEDCPSWFGDFTESLMIHYYPGAKRMQSNHPGFDYIWINEEKKEVMIDHKGACLYYSKGSRSPNFNFTIGWNDKADIFILSGWDNRDSLHPMFAWEFKKNDLIRLGNGSYAPKVEFWRRQIFAITYTPEGLSQFIGHQICIDWLEKKLKTDKCILC